MTTNLPNLKDLYKPYFKLGCALGDQIFTDVQRQNIVLHQFNSCTAGNAFKWDSFGNDEQHYDYTNADKFYNFAIQNGLEFHGHVFVWHYQYPNYLNNKTLAQLKDSIVNHMHLLCSRYPKVYSWDIVNEALKDSDGLLRTDNVWSKLGDQYISFPFITFHNTEGASNPILAVYNDYNIEYGAKLQGCVNQITSLKQQNIKVDAVGIQAHWGLTWPSIATIEAALIQYHNMGLKIHISELDIDTNPNGTTQSFTSSLDDQLAQRYKDIFTLFLKHSDKIMKVTFWGITDQDSWLRTFPTNRNNYPLLFDDNYNPKKAYWALVSLVGKVYTITSDSIEITSFPKYGTLSINLKNKTITYNSTSQQADQFTYIDNNKTIVVNTSSGASSSGSTSGTTGGATGGTSSSGTSGTTGGTSSGEATGGTSSGTSIQKLSETKWIGGASLQYRLINNTTKDINNWSVNILITGGTISSYWNIDVVSGNVYKNKDFNNVIKANGGYVEFGFNLSYTSTYAISVQII